MPTGRRVKLIVLLREVAATAAAVLIKQWLTRATEHSINKSCDIYFHLHESRSRLCESQVVSADHSGTRNAHETNDRAPTAATIENYNLNR